MPSFTRCAKFLAGLGRATSERRDRLDLGGCPRLTPLPLDATGDAEVVLLGVCHSDPPGPPEALRAFVDALCTQSQQPVDFGFDVVNHKVEVHAVLARFGFGYALKEKR